MKQANYQNPNTERFWEEKLKGVSTIQTTDLITKHRIGEIVQLIPDKDISLLDIGVGYGFLETALNELRPKTSVIGMDITPKNLNVVSNRTLGRYVLGTALSLPFSQSKFDVVCILEVLEHLFVKDAKKALEESLRVLQSNGILIVSVPLFDKPFIGHPSGHMREIFPDQIIQEIKNVGFEIKKTTMLAAFRSHFRLKSLINRIFFLRKPNNMIIEAVKK